MRIIGIDPGLRCLGWGVVDVDGTRMRHVANGQCKPGGTDLAGRLLRLHAELSDIIAGFRPDTGAIEQTFVNADGAGTLKLGQARGVALLALAQAGLEVGEYAPNTIKKAVVGRGHAAKAQIGYMIALQFPGAKVDGPDAADALAIAICHAHLSAATSRLEDAVRKASQ